MSEGPAIGRWRNANAEQRYRAIEDELWNEFWPDPPASLDVDTHFGSTRAYQLPGTGMPVVFLHGATGTSLAWTEYVEQVGGRPAYAIDTIGEVGRSRQHTPIESGADLAQWLDETLAGLGVERAHLVGMSYGGFLALNQAACTPGRVCSLTLLDPIGIVPIRMVSFMCWGMGSMAASKLPRTLRSRAAQYLRMPAIENERIMGMMRISGLAYERRLVRPAPLSDAQLGSITVPVLLVVPDRSEVHAVNDLVRRAKALLPNVEVLTIAGAGHAVPLSHREAIVDAMHTFLDRQDAASTP